MSVYISESEADERFKQELEERGKLICPGCQKIVDRSDVAWNNASTEAGTGYCVIEIQCSVCDTEIGHYHSWYPWIETFEELVECTLYDWS